MRKLLKLEDTEVDDPDALQIKKNMGQIKSVKA